MKPSVVSVNTGEPVTIEWKGQKVQTGIWKHPVDDPIFLGKTDVENDHVMDRKHHGGIDKACYIYPADHYSYWKKLISSEDLSWGMFGENITVNGLHEADVHIGDTWQIGSATVQVSQPRQPCYKLNIRFDNPRISKLFVQSGLSGIYVRVLSPGKVSKGDEITVIEKHNSVSVQEVFNLLYANDFDEEAVNKAIGNAYLAESCRRDLVKKWQDFFARRD